MDHLDPRPKLYRIDPPGRQIRRIQDALRPINQAYISDILGEIHEYVEMPINWNLLKAVVGFWDPQHAMFNFHETKLAPTIEEYRALIDIVIPNLFATTSN
ncbi:hypothetical protein CDL15_Pgr009196 [Punica granatum]|uniref:DUF7745 domain-containing protein n=1 Tax=Punica granatum TaxID=22663 RepID=A0A218WWQ0_PUNGR|nr:hypothetical protein CDL15_Pgr009196 [Punica granatum]